MPDVKSAEDERPSPFPTHQKAKSPQDRVTTSGASPIEEPTAPAEASSAPIEGNYF